MSNPIITVATQAARAAGKVIIKSLNIQRELQIEEKGRNNYVTDIDRECDQAILTCLQKAYPKHSFLTEEHGLIRGQQEDHLWIIDPIDGTTNFIHGLPHFAISIALQINNITKHGVIYNPITDQLFTVTKGEGAQLNGKRLRVSKHQKIEGGLISPAFPRTDHFEDTYAAYLSDLGRHCGGIRYSGSAALDLAYIAAGYLNALWRTDLKPWDIAAGILMIREAGGMVMDLQGGVELEQGNFIAANPKFIKLLLSELTPHLKNKKI